MLTEQDRDDLYHRLNQMLDKIEAEVIRDDLTLWYTLKRVREELEKVI